ncbi:MAG: NADH-quinone oxidoreductase subunit NuoH [Holophagales bacterium]|nr:NADH-quinone oxidoreductase subunit NuoH [Holophagales bacterium]
MSAELVAALAKMGLWIVFLISVAPIMLWVERRVPAFMQDRLGPNRVGPLGFFQGIADAAKFIFKEDIEPATADRGLYLLAPVLALVPCMTTYLVIPFGPEIEVAGRKMASVVIDSDSGIFVFLALASLGVYSLVLAGYASNNKWSLIGAIRASAQMISYELGLTMAVVAALIPAGTLNLTGVVQYQVDEKLFGFLPAWGVFVQPLGFLVFLVAMFAETNRLPFDLPEAESELVAGYHTEYGSIRFALFFMGEYMAMAVLSALAATLYFGGWSLPGLDLASFSGPWPAILGFVIITIKVALFMFFYVWVRWTYPRFRYDQLMRLGWKVLLPIALVNLVLVSALAVGGKL